MYALEFWRSVALLHFGWVIGSLQGATRLASRTFPPPSQNLRSKLLTDTTKHSKLNENAPFRPPPRAANSDKWLQG